MPRGVSRCPNCREPVSPFAAGCAICGADLELARAKAAARPQIALPRARVPEWLPRMDWLHLAIALVLVLAAPPVGFVLSLYWAFARNRAGEPAMVAAMLIIAAVAIAALFAPIWFWSHLLNL
jgi:hypothetical protein